MELLLTADALRVFYHTQASGWLGEPERFYITGENLYNMMIEDVSGTALRMSCT